MFERFTEGAIKVVMYAQEEARRFNHPYVGNEHMFLGIIGEGKSLSCRVLDEAGVNLKDTRMAIEAILHRGLPSAAIRVEMPFTPNTKLTLHAAYSESVAQHSAAITSDHLVLSLLASEEITKVMEAMGVKTAGLVHQIMLRIMDAKLQACGGAQHYDIGIDASVKVRVEEDNRVLAGEKAHALVSEALKGVPGMVNGKITVKGAVQ